MCLSKWLVASYLISTLQSMILHKCWSNTCPINHHCRQWVGRKCRLWRTNRHFRHWIVAIVAGRHWRSVIVANCHRHCRHWGSPFSPIAIIIIVIGECFLWIIGDNNANNDKGENGTIGFEWWYTKACHHWKLKIAIVAFEMLTMASIVNRQWQRMVIAIGDNGDWVRHCCLIIDTGDPLKIDIGPKYGFNRQITVVQFEFVFSSVCSSLRSLLFLGSSNLVFVFVFF